jgi:hypothetical protein
MPYENKGLFNNIVRFFIYTVFSIDILELWELINLRHRTTF